MVSVDKLCELADKLDEAAARMSEHGFSPIGLKMKIVCDEIEREIEERYMELPTDADGVPIRVGDVMEPFDCPKGDYARFVVGGYTSEFPEGKGVLMVESEPDDAAWYGCDIRHVKQRTLEDVLREMVGMTDQPLCEEDIKAFADEIRELMSKAGDAQ